MNLQSTILLLVVLFLAGVALCYRVRQRRRGGGCGGCCGCSGCEGCSLSKR